MNKFDFGYHVLHYVPECTEVLIDNGVRPSLARAQTAFIQWTSRSRSSYLPTTSWGSAVRLLRPPLPYLLFNSVRQNYDKHSLPSFVRSSFQPSQHRRDKEINCLLSNHVRHLLCGSSASGRARGHAATKPSNPTGGRRADRYFLIAQKSDALALTTLIDGRVPS